MIYAFCNTYDVSWNTKRDNTNTEKLNSALVIEKGDKATIKINDKCLNINESTYTDDMFTSIMKDFCLEDADLITICGKLETSCSRYHRQGLHEGSSVDNTELPLMLSEINLSDENFTKIGNFETKFLNIDKSKRGHKIDAAIGVRLMKENLIQFLVVESKKPGADPSNDKRKQLQEQYDQLEITVYDIPGSLIGRRHLFRQNIYVPSKMQLKHHTVDYLESLVEIKEILNKLVNEGNNSDNNVQISIRNGTIVRKHRNSSGVMY
ncbi:19236_t:CDS:2 [Racocetra fulgida]|uniref:19236_t:CDS:1 n=1 Tax=Racocetra fulgida TaxID=60492 RepID=A0A9N9AK84_9GLOM|nr:19236_t:CDS:2 [Racocetra fulgida]